MMYLGMVALQTVHTVHNFIYTYISTFITDPININDYGPIDFLL